MKPLLPALLFFATTTFAGWTSGGPTGGAVNAVVVAPSDPAVVWAANAAGVFRSADGGATWANVGGTIVDAGFIAVHPTDANRAWIAAGWATTARVYRTSDGGATWADSTDGLPSIYPSTLLVDRRNPDTLYLGSQCSPIGYTNGLPFEPATPGVFKSTDGGATWHALASPPTPAIPCAEELAIDPFSPWRLFLSGAYDDGGRQFESFDSGDSWEIAHGPRPTHGVVFDARYPFTHYGFTKIYGRHMMVSQDGGFTWREVPTDLPLNASWTSLSMDPERSRIFLGTTSGVYRSGNGGSVWAKTSLQGPSVAAVDFGGTPRALFAATSEGLFAIANRGLGDASAIDLHDIAANVAGLAVDPGAPDIVYAGGRGKVFRSNDRGATWQRVAGDDDTPKADVISVDAAGNVYALQLTIPGTGPGALVRRGRDDASWTLTPVVDPYDVAADPKNAGTAFLAYNHGVSRTRDGGLTWQRVTAIEPAGHLAIDPSDPRWVYAGDAKSLQRSNDGGDTWTTLQNDRTYALVVNGSVLYRDTFANGTYRVELSDDRGVTWHALAIATQFVAPVIAVDPRDASSVWAAADVVLYHSADGGATWQIVDPPFRVSAGATRLVFDPSGRVLHVVYPNHGVWELTTQ